MEWKSLIAGLVFTMGMYAAKCGIGLACGWTQRESRRLSFIAVAALAYTLLFAGCFLLLTRVNLLNKLLIVEHLVKWAMAVHAAMASLLLVWGSALLKKPAEGTEPVRGWLLFALPCPVCMGVILLTIAFVIGFFPENALAMTAMAWGIFAVVASVGFLATRCLGTRFAPPHHVMGTMMVLAALWFLLTILVVPHVSELPDVFAMASGAADSARGGENASITTAIVACCLFGGGIFLDRFFHTH
ncbi:DUF2162 family putative transporter [Desulfoluna butyratoxydans]|uniref:Uncharacterized conserved protein ucp037409 membrane transporter mth672 n=1 Tax=Desulfoluna butyratoxydans TaxID=231438 RepID=A0A4U8YSA0_9BACT|nr:DUF2162 family putative transporter [Desulfoluna butyratoxydans]VFQ46781.1 uncharacterised conserved protein ucp037409 membrane transporter mth672 [Desulfoluna butyratoxydans]